MTQLEIGLYVVDVTMCYNCMGRGEVENPAWQPFNVLMERWAESDDRYETDPPDPSDYMPPHEVKAGEFLECNNCLGDGRVRQNVSLLVALRRLGLDPLPEEVPF